MLPSLLYRRLARLLEEGVVKEADTPADPDPRKKYYELTDLGRRLVRREAERIVDLARSLERYRWSQT